DVRAAVGSRYGEILPAEGHLFDLLEPEDVVPEWKRWSPILLRPDGLYRTRPGAAGSLEPFDPAGGQEPGGAGRVLVADAALPKVSERRDARMRMPADAWKRPSLGIEE